MSPLERICTGKEGAADLLDISVGLLDQLNKEGHFRPHGFLHSLPRWDTAKLLDEWRRYIRHNVEDDGWSNPSL
jgi:hypothetical protein